jgi:hypothetical protein
MWSLFNKKSLEPALVINFQWGIKSVDAPGSSDEVCIRGRDDARELRDNSLCLAMFGLSVLFVLGQSLAGYYDYKAE